MTKNETAILHMEIDVSEVDTDVKEVAVVLSDLVNSVGDLCESLSYHFTEVSNVLNKIEESISGISISLEVITGEIASNLLMPSPDNSFIQWLEGITTLLDSISFVVNAASIGMTIGTAIGTLFSHPVAGGLIGAGVGATVALIVEAVGLIVSLIYDNWDTISAALQQVFSEIQTAVAGITEWFSSSVIPFVTSFFANLWEVIAYYGPLFWEEIVNFATGIWNELVSIFHGAAQWVGDNVITPVMDLFAPIVDWFAALFGSIWQTIDDVFYNIGVTVVGCWDTIHTVWNAVAAWFNNTVIQPIYNFFANLWTGVVGLVTTAWTEIMTFLGNIATWMDAHVIQPLVTLFAGVWEDFAAFAADAWDAVCNVFGAVAAFFENVFADAWAGIVAVFDIAGEIFVNIGDAVLSAFRVIANGIIGGLNNVLAVPFNGINGAITIIRNMEILDIRPFSRLRNITVPQIPYLAKGAVLPANKPFLAMVGDQKHGTNIEAPLATIQDAVALVMNDQAAAMMAGFEAVVRAINEKNATLELDGREIWAAYNAYNRKAAVVKGHIGFRKLWYKKREQGFLKLIAKNGRPVIGLIPMKGGDSHADVTRRRGKRLHFWVSALIMVPKGAW